VLYSESLNAKFYWDANDPRTAVSSLVAQGVYEERETRILTHIVEQSRTTLDIGANVGYYAVVLGLALGKKSSLVAIEPLERASDQLTANLKLNHLEGKVTSIQVALSDSDGFAELHVPERSGSSATSLRSLHPSESELRVSVETRSLDSLVKEKAITNIDLIKIDVEGAEWLVLQGGWGVVTSYRPVIFAEMLRKWSAGFDYHPNIVLHALKDLGYSCFAVGDTLKPISEIKNETVETNFLFLTSSDRHLLLIESLCKIMESP